MVSDGEPAAHDGGAASGRQSRPHAPPVLSRPRLLDRIDLASPVTVLRAPSGFGKTTLVAHWARNRVSEDTICAWLRVPESHDATPVWAALAEALHDAGLAIPLGEPASFGRIARTLNEAPHRVVLVVDGLGNLSDQRFDADLLDLVHHAPSVRLVACVRSTHRLPAHQILDLGATIIEAPELLFTGDEVRELAAALDPHLGVDVIDAVAVGCGGWPALTSAVLLALANDVGPTMPADVPGRVERITGDYVWGRLLPSSLPAKQRELALVTSVPETFTAELAGELAAGPRTRDHLDDLLSRGLLDVRVRDGEQVMEWPATVRRVLRAEFERRHGGRVAAVHAILARSYASRGSGAPALHHAVRSSEWALVVDIVASQWRALLVSSPSELVEAINATPLHYLGQDRRAAAMRDVVLQLPAEQMLTTDDLPRSPDALDELGRSASVAETLDTALAVLIALRNCAAIDLARDYAARLLRVARAARKTQPAAIAALYPSVLSQIGVTLMYASDLKGAVEPTREAYRRAGDSPFDYLARETASKLALIHALDGDLRRAKVWLARHDAAQPSTSWLTTFIDPVPELARLLAALDRLDLAAASTTAEDVIRHVYPERAWVWQVYARAMLAPHTGTAQDALHRIDEARSVRLQWHEPRIIGARMLDAVEADLLLSLGRARHAQSILHGEHARHRYLRVGQARLALLSGDPEGALSLSLDPEWERRATIRQRHEMLLIRAIASHRLADHEAATSALERAAAAAAATGALRPFTTVPRSELAEIARRVPLAVEQLAVARLASHPDLFPASLRVVTLSPREQQVLEKLAAGLSLRDAAAALVVSYNTIRTQQGSVYHKLGVNNRPEALARAREQGLL